MSQITFSYSRPRRLTAPAESPRLSARRVIAQLSLWQSRQIQRRELRSLSQNQLIDMGIDQEALEIESKKMFWQK